MINRMISTTLWACSLLVSARLANAATINVTVLNSTQIQIEFGGALDGPAPDLNLGNLFLDIADTVPNVLYDSIAGNLAIGGFSVSESFVGFNNDPYGNTLQLRTGQNGSDELFPGAALTGSGIVTFQSAHGLGQSEFDAGVPIFWGRASGLGFGTFQGVTNSEVINPPSEVPLPAGMALLLGGLGSLTVLRRKRFA